MRLINKDLSVLKSAKFFLRMFTRPGSLRFSRICSPLLKLAVILSLGACLPVSTALAAFELRESIGHQWRHERVVFPMADADLSRAKAGHALIGPDGQAIAYQIIPAAGVTPAALTFLVDLPPLAQQAYKWAPPRPIPETDLRITETKNTLRMENTHTGIELRKQLTDEQGPILRVRMPSGTWVGDSQLLSDLPLTGYTLEITGHGPVFAEVVCRAVLGDDSSWELRIRLDAGEPVIVIEEISSVKSDATRLRLDLHHGLEPTHVFHRRAGQDGFRFVLRPIQTGRVFLLQPWQNWFQSPIQGATFSLHKDGHSDLLMIGAGMAGRWIDPEIPSDQRQPANAVLTCGGEGKLHLDFTLKSGQRHWLIGALTANEALSMEDDQYPVTPLVQQYVIKHGQFPLDRIKDQILRWDLSKAEYPGLLLSMKEIKRFRQSLDTEEIERYQKRISHILNRRIDRYYLDEPIENWCATGDERIARHVIAGAETHMQEALDCFLVQSIPYGSAPHNTSWLGTAMTLADTALATGLMTDQERERMLARAAFIAYAIERPDYWCTSRGYAGLPNMTTSVYGYLAAAASLIPTHPRSKDWGWRALGVLRWQLNNWSDEKGGWMEAPHYAIVSYDAILGALAMANNAGISNWLHTEQRVKEVGNWLSKISTPPDSRINGIRHLPHLGHTYLFEPTGIFGTLAFLFRETDPGFASQMQWMWREQGSFDAPGIASMYATMAGYRTLMQDMTIQPEPPAWKSEVFPKTGVILRNGFPDPRETQLYLIAGAHRSHYDDDSGSFTIWGKGRIVSDMFGYCGASPAWVHSLVESPKRARVMNIESFAAADALDYVSGLAGGWRRQIAMVKDHDLMGPNFFMISDSFNEPTDATWRLWLAADEVLVGAPPEQSVLRVGKAPTGYARAVGGDDVDTDIFFFYPADTALSADPHTRKAGAGLLQNRSFGPMSSTQIALTARAKSCPTITTLIYPRLKEESIPRVAWSAEGRVAQIETPAGTDYVFLNTSSRQAAPDENRLLAPETFLSADGKVVFQGTAGAVQVRGSKITLSLGAAGTVRVGAHELSAEGPATKTAGHR